MDKIFLKNMEFFAFHGVLNDERINGQYFEIDVEMNLDLSEAIKSDDLRDTVDYGQIYLIVKDETMKNRYNLVETRQNHRSDIQEIHENPRNLRLGAQAASAY